MPHLIAVSGPLEGRTFEVSEQPLTIGRTDTCGLVVKHNKVSRNHASVIYKEGRCLVRDNASSNGTFLDGIRLPAHESRLILAGDELRIGNAALRLIETDLNLDARLIEKLELTHVVDETPIWVTYRARQLAVARDVAVRILKPDYAGRKADMGRFVHEARAAAKLNHPHILPTHDIGRVGDAICYCTQELFQGPRLSFRLGLEMKTAFLVQLMTQAADALEYAHERGIYHGDLTPRHILVDDDGEVRLQGIGQAECYRADDAPPAMPYYRSPEAVQGRPIDGRSDLYSLGAILFHALAGKPVFDGLNPADLARKVSNAIRPPIAEEASKIDPDLAEIVDRLLERVPDNRFQTAADLRQALGAVGQAVDDRTEERPAPVVAEAEEEIDRIASASSRRKATSSGVTRTSGRSSTRAKPQTTVRSSNRDEQGDFAFKAMLLLGAVVLAVLVGGAVWMRSPPRTIDEIGGDAGVEGGGLEQEFSQAKAMLSEGRLGEARKAFESIKSRYANAAIQSRADLMLGQVAEATRRRQREELVEQAWAKYVEFRDANPNERDALVERLNRLKEDVPELAKRAEEEQARVVGTVDASLAALRESVRALAEEGRFDTARAKISTFKAEQPDFPDMGDVETLAAEVEAEFKDRMAFHQTTLKEKVKRQLYGAALRECETIRQRIQVKTVLAAIDKTEKTIRGLIAKKYKTLQDKIRIFLGQRKFVDALKAYNDDSFSLAGTEYETRTKALGDLIGGARRMNDYVMSQLQAGVAKPMPGSFDFPELERVRAGGGTPKVTGMTAEGLRVSGGGTGAIIPWASLRRKHLADLYGAYVDDGGAEHAKALGELRSLFAQ